MGHVAIQSNWPIVCENAFGNNKTGTINKIYIYIKSHFITTGGISIWLSWKNKFVTIGM